MTAKSKSNQMISFFICLNCYFNGKEKERPYSLSIMYKVFYILDGDLLNSALLV